MKWVIPSFKTAATAGGDRDAGLQSEWCDASRLKNLREVHRVAVSAARQPDSPKKLTGIVPGINSHVPECPAAVSG